MRKVHTKWIGRRGMRAARRVLLPRYAFFALACLCACALVLRPVLPGAAPQRGMPADGTPLFGTPAQSVQTAPREDPPGTGDAPDIVAASASLDTPLKLYDHRANKLIETTLETYLLGVVPSEMPVSYAPEALKAQAVAARTYTLRKMRSMGGGGCGRCKGADICTDSSHCQAWHSQAQLDRLWGSNRKTYAALVKTAVEGTRGLVVAYDGAPIEALFHAVSGGQTEDVENVYSQSLPYLRGVVSRGEESSPSFHSTVSMTRREFERAVSGLKPGLSDAALGDQVEILSTTPAGRVLELRIGKARVTGGDARKMFGLKAAGFTLNFPGGGIEFDVSGYGHGVGMSQTGAQAMARQGDNFVTILTHYYTDTQVAAWDTLKKHK